MLNQYWHLSLYDFDTYNLALRPIIPSCLYERYLHAVGDGADMFWAKLGCWSKDCHHPFLWSKRIMSCRWEKCSYQEGDKSLSQQQRSHQEEPAQSQHIAPPLSEYPYNNSNDFTINFLWSWVSAMEVLISSQVSIYFHALSRQQAVQLYSSFINITSWQSFQKILSFISPPCVSFLWRIKNVQLRMIEVSLVKK